MLQQTRVATVIPYFEKWMTTFPDISILASASEGEVLHLWEGLGYYQRAINILKTAKIVTKDYKSHFPNDIDFLKSLPGIGSYTAAAITSIAFNNPSPAIDGNIRRIICRVNDIKSQVDLPSTEKHIKEFLLANKPSANVGDFNQALMDLGAMICKPRKPDCSACPIKNLCISYSLNNQENRPVMKFSSRIPQYFYVCALIKHNDDYLIVKRSGEKFLGGLWEFPNERSRNSKDNQEEYLSKTCLEKYGIKIRVLSVYGVYKHVYTHFKQEMHVYNCELAEQDFIPDRNKIWTNLLKISDYPMGKISRNIAKSIGQQ